MFVLDGPVEVWGEFVRGSSGAQLHMLAPEIAIGAV